METRVLYTDNNGTQYIRVGQDRVPFLVKNSGRDENGEYITHNGVRYYVRLPKSHS